VSELQIQALYDVGPVTLTSLCGLDLSLNLVTLPSDPCLACPRLVTLTFDLYQQLGSVTCKIRIVEIN